MSWDLIFEHLFIVISAGILSVITGLALGILACLFPKIKPVILWMADLLQTIPSLALLGILMVLLSPGKLIVILGITLYSLLPIVRNTCLGLEEVDAGVKEAARGMGMGQYYRLFVIELPLAFPTIFTGIRIAVVNTIGTAVFAAFVGGGGLGSVITQGIRISDMKMILTATAVLMVIAAVLDFLMSCFENKMRRSADIRKMAVLSAAVLLTVFCLLLPYGKNETGDIMLYDGDYSETQLMHHMAKMLIEDQTELEVIIQDQMSQVNNFRAMQNPDFPCDLMISYDGTLLTTFFHQDTKDVPVEMSIYDYVSQVAEKKYQMKLLKKLGFDNTYAVAVPEKTADEYNLETVSDLIPIADRLTFGAEQGFFTMEGSMKYKPFTEFYGLKFKDAVSVDLGLKYTAIENGSVDVTVVYATDGLNRKTGLKILEDDKKFFPDYNGAFLVCQDTLKKYPEIEPVLDQLAGKITTEQMAELTYQVDVLGNSVDDTARKFLRDRKLIK